MAIQNRKKTEIELDPYGVPVRRIKTQLKDNPYKKVGGGGGGRAGGGGITSGSLGIKNSKGMQYRKNQIANQLYGKNLFGNKGQMRIKTSKIKGKQNMIATQTPTYGSQATRVRTKYSPATIKSNTVDPVTGLKVSSTRTQSSSSFNARLKQGQSAKETQIQNFKKANLVQQKNRLQQKTKIQTNKTQTKIQTQLKPLPKPSLQKTNLAPINSNKNQNFTVTSTGIQTNTNIDPGLKQAPSKTEIQPAPETNTKTQIQIKEFTGQTMEGSNKYGLFRQPVVLEQVKIEPVQIDPTPKIEPVTTTAIQIEPVTIPKVVKEPVVVEQISIEPTTTPQIQIDPPIKEPVTKKDYIKVIEGAGGGGGGNNPPPPPPPPSPTKIDGGGGETPPPPPPPPPPKPSDAKAKPLANKKKDSKNLEDIELKPGEFPKIIAHRQGVVEREINTDTGETKVGKDLHEEVPNNPKIKPSASIRIIETTEKQPSNLEGRLTSKLYYRYDNSNSQRPKVVFFRRPGAKSKR